MTTQKEINKQLDKAIEESRQFIELLQDIQAGLSGNPFEWDSDKVNEKMLEKYYLAGVTLMTAKGLKDWGYRLKKSVTPVGFVMIDGKLKKVYVLECQAEPIDKSNFVTNRLKTGDKTNE